jgi:SulP family sulfate permease
MAALVAVMFVVAYSTFDWNSIKPGHLKRMPGSETAVMTITVILTVATGNLSIGVIAGVIAAALLFARRVQHMTTVTRLHPHEQHSRHHLHLPRLRHRHTETGEPPANQGNTVGALAAPSDPTADIAVYQVAGELFFASSSDLGDHFDYAGDPDTILIDLTHSHIWDASTVASLDQVIARYAHRGKRVELIGLNQASTHIHSALAGHLASSH